MSTACHSSLRLTRDPWPNRRDTWGGPVSSIGVTEAERLALAMPLPSHARRRACALIEPKPSHAGDRPPLPPAA